MRGKRTLLGLLLLGTLSGGAQVLARPGWAGSGVAPETWWRRAVFYRIDPHRFQDSDGDGQGDFHGIAERLDYLQSIGVDALLLEGSPANSSGSPDASDLDDLIRQASTRHLRIVLAVPQASDGGASNPPQNALLSTIHGWLSAGAAGVYLQGPTQSTGAKEASPSLLPALQAMLRSFPGERVLLTDVAPAIAGPELRNVSRRGQAGASPGSRGAVLISAARFPVETAGVSVLRSSLMEVANVGSRPEATPLLQVEMDPATGSPRAALAGALLFASKGASVLHFGEEIGLDLDRPLGSSTTKTAANDVLPVMQWTPSNRTAAPGKETEAKPAGSETVYGAYHPYLPMVRSLAGPGPAPVRVVPDPNIAPDLPAPDTLPGFTTGELPVPPVDGNRVNVVTEDRDPKSLLNFYRQLIGLHHDNPALRNGSQYVLNHDAEGALVWLRRAPDNTRTAANVVVAANLTDRPVTLELDSEMESAGMRGGALRPLCLFAAQPITGATTAHLTLPAHAVFLGEIYHGGGSEAAPRRHRSRHRGRG